MVEAERNIVMLASEWLSKCGELREELLPVLWEPLGVRRDDYGDVLRMLCMAGMLLLCAKTQAGRRWLADEPMWLVGPHRVQFLKIFGHV